MSRRLVLKHPIALVGILVCVSCLLVVIVTVLELPEPTPRDREMGIYHPTFKSKKVPKNFKLGKFGEIVVEMLPQDLAFTIFIPSEEAIKRDLHLSVNESLVTEKFSDTYAILTRILGFSAVPRELSKKVPQNFKLGKFGEMMVEMLPQDLAFTIFIPSEKAFKRDLHLSVNESLVTEKFNDTYAILTRILGFSAVPRELSSCTSW